MMLKQALVEKFKTLSKVHKDLVTSQHGAEEKRTLINKQLESIEHTTTKIEGFKKSLHDAQKTVDHLELELQSLNNEEKNIKNKIEKNGNQRAINALDKELAHLQTERLEEETALERAWQALETTKTRYKQSVTTQKEDIEKLETNIKELEAEAKALDNQIVTTLASRNQALADIPEEWRTKYERMLHSVEDPIVPLNNNVCSACFYSTVDQDFARLKHNEILNCRNCYRLLYLETAAEKQNY